METVNIADSTSNAEANVAAIQLTEMLLKRQVTLIRQGKMEPFNFRTKNGNENYLFLASWNWTFEAGYINVCTMMKGYSGYEYVACLSLAKLSSKVSHND